MKTGTVLIALSIACMFQVQHVHAQDDLDLDALLQDISAEQESTPVEIEAVDELQVEQSEPAAVETQETAFDEVEVAPAEVTDVPETDESEMAEEVSQADPAEQAAALAYAEEVRRQALEIEALQAIEEGYQQLNAEKYEAAATTFETALKKLPQRPVTDEARQRAKWGLSEAYVQISESIYKKEGDLSVAEAAIEHAVDVDPENRSALSLQKKINRALEKQAEITGQRVKAKDLPEVLEREATIKDLMARGKEFFNINDFDRAALFFEQVLLKDPYQVDAMRFLAKIEEYKYDVATKEREFTTSDMIQEVRDTWNAPIKDEVDLPDIATDGSPVSQTAAQRLQDKMRDIVIPSIEFRSANIHDVVNFLVEASEAGDEDGVGVNIILNLQAGGSSAASGLNTGSGNSNPFASGGGFGFDDEMDSGGTGGGSSFDGGDASVPSITLNLRRVTLMDAIKYITEVADLKYRIEDNAVIITPAGVVTGRVVTRLYPVQPSILDVVVQRAEDNTGNRSGEFIEMGSSTSFQKSDVKEFFQRAGVPFPQGTSITYNSAISQLIVANTPENLEIFERILSQLNVIPNQVEIEARFVEITETDLQEMGLEWILTDDYEIAQNKSSGAFASNTETIQANANPDGFTQGLRFFNVSQDTGAIAPASAITQNLGSSALGSLLSFSSILTNPELTVVLHALDQNGNSDVLSAPRVTTRSGVNAQIEVVQEIIYPTEFEVTEPTVNVSDTGNGVVTPPTVTPGSFETRETGVILNVTPTVGPDGYTIDLTMAPEVAELVDWIQYGSTATVGDSTFAYNIPQPVFSSRNVTTSIVIWDGQTVVMGGLIRESLVTVNDKIPILGDIPLLGRLFRNEGEYSQKKNLLIFVTARLVDPAGRPIHKQETVTGVGGGTADMSAQ